MGSEYENGPVSLPADRATSTTGSISSADLRSIQEAFELRDNSPASGVSPVEPGVLAESMRRRSKADQLVIDLLQQQLAGCREENARLLNENKRLYEELASGLTQQLRASPR